MSDANPTRATRTLWRLLLAIVTLVLTAAGIGLIASGGAQAASGSVGPLSDTLAITTAPATGGSTLWSSPFPPSVPTDLTATAVHTTSVTLSWTAATQGCCPVTGYDITYGEAFSDLLYVANVANVTTATITSNIRANGQYRFSVRAHDDLGHNSNNSATLTLVTPASDTATDQTAPSAPMNLATANVTATTVDLSWSPSTDNVAVTGYNVYSFDGLFVNTLLATVSGTSYTAPLNTTRPSSEYYVRARDAAGNQSIASNPVNAPGGPQTGSASPPTSMSPSPKLSCKVSYTTMAQWSGGFVAGITITNTGATPIVNWTLTFVGGGGFQVTSSWSATWSQSGTSISLRNLDWNSTIAPGASTSMGIQGTWSGTLATPTGFAVNGVPCATG